MPSYLFDAFFLENPKMSVNPTSEGNRPKLGIPGIV